MTDRKPIKSKKAVVSVRLVPEIKQHLDRVLKSNGMTISEAVRLYFWQIITQGGVPFKGFTSNKLPIRSVPSESELKLQSDFAKLQATLLATEVEAMLKSAQYECELRGDDDDDEDDEEDEPDILFKPL